MRIIKLSVFFLLFAWLVVVNGCVSEEAYNDVKLQNETQRKRMDDLTSQLQTKTMQLEKLKNQLVYAKGAGGIEAGALREEVAALERTIQERDALIARMREQLLGEGALPPELTHVLEEFAKGQDMVTYDADRGIVKFKSDLLFKSGSDTVLPGAAEAVKSLCGILNSEQAKAFDIIIAGHTDDQPIRVSAPRHPTNWHLSAHRAISVLEIMTRSNIATERMSARGFGEFRPVVPNKPGKKGNPQNRRVEIYIVPKGM
jgi:chemotaxis protein MotB